MNSPWEPWAEGLLPAVFWSLRAAHAPWPRSQTPMAEWLAFQYQSRADGTVERKPRKEV